MNEAVILMSTYNGERFLAEQIQSIQHQTVSNWKLLIRDDGSKDQTILIIKKFAEQDPRIIFIEDTVGNVKPTQSFSILLKQALDQQADFIFFADQDDVWLENKLALQIAALENVDKTIPTLVFSDLTVVNQDLTVLHPSFLDFEELTPQTENALNTLLAYNYITGCAMGINRALAEAAFPIPIDAMMHDWWCALCAAALGRIQFIPTATVLYRQHGMNELGSKGFKNKMRNIFKFFQQKKSFENRFRQAMVFAERLQRQQNKNEMVTGFCSVLQKNRMARLFFVFQYHLVPDHLIRKWVFLFFMMVKK